MFSNQKIKDGLESDIIRSIHLHIEEISKILSEESKNSSEKELLEKMYLVSARMIALTALREGDKSPIPGFLSKNKKYDSPLTRITIREINAIKHQSSLQKNQS
ncbi:MAG: hypothetical protein C4617_04980 [Candidatus Liberibacter europaeus]|uniref:Uncharacterized protein n=1 Tax=Candidatus Liberibacter europaeus TaxID=744859 RepID=A0A2T4VWS3_9HYPH|nr:hypothetical protein [Candidatus Liberibacter europaeus]PTL86226.1 MAG: hypothetical protein C4617_04980 [Candidatus Liberibacter europaeus]